MADNLIRWKRGDYVRLSRAINKFNKEITSLENQGYSNLPEIRSYKSVKENIYTRKELNRLVNSMKKFNLDTAKTVELESGQRLTAWEYKELINARTRAKHTLENKLEIMERENPYAKFGLETKEITQMKQTLKSLSKLETKAKGFELNRLMDRIKRLGSYDSEMKRANQYKENYMKALEQMSGYDNYELLRDKLNSIKNPEKFYEFIQNSTTLSDLFEYYKDDSTAQTYGGFDSNQEAFNRALEQLGLLEINEPIDISDQVVSIL